MKKTPFLMFGFGRYFHGLQTFSKKSRSMSLVFAGAFEFKVLVSFSFFVSIRFFGMTDEMLT